MYVLKGLSILVSVIAFNVMMYCAIQGVMVPLNNHLDVLDQVVELQDQYRR